MEKNISAFIVDDEQKAVDTLTRTIQSFFPQIDVVGCSNSVADAINKIKTLQPRLVFLDIEMGVENGFDLLSAFDPVPFHVAFVTAHEEYALRAIKLSALDYIIKPASLNELKSLFNKIENETTIHEGQKVKQLFGNFNAGDKDDHRITVAVSEGYEFIRVNDILYLLADGSYTLFYLKNGTKLTTSRSLKFFEELLEEYGFFRIHHSSFINIKYIKRVSKSAGGSVIMEDGNELSISKSRKQEFMEALSLK